MSNIPNGPVLVTGATGTQGGAVAKALLRAGQPVRALVRDPATTAAQALSALGVNVVSGDQLDAASFDMAMRGVTGVFSVQPVVIEDMDAEARLGQALVDAADRAGVDMLVHASVARAGDHLDFAGWDQGRWWSAYWEKKGAVIEAVTARKTGRHVILKPATLMENWVPPKADAMHSALVARGVIETVIDPDTRVDMIAADDVGAFAAAAFADPARFHGHAIDLAAESLTMEEVAARITAGTGQVVTARSLSEEEMLAKGAYPFMVTSELWTNVEGYQVDITATRSWGLPLTSFSQWIAEHRDEFVIGR